ncbi:hypothetical protein ACJJTC_006022 [Scirpophaga incertulas]
MKWREILIFSLCLICCSEQRSSPGSDSYVAAVLEYQFTRNTTQNLQNYIQYIQEAAEQDTDILVFPEMTLTRGEKINVPIHGLLKMFPVPALHPDLFDTILVELSGAARHNNIYVVVNLQEVMDCSKATEEYCPENKTYIFNTNVVFDRTGAIIDRYRKINLFGEYTRNAALKPELGLFETDFGVTFGHFICFDLMFQVPATQVIQKHNLTDIIFSTMWFSEMPFLTAIQIQEAYAYAMNVNFLAAGADNVNVTSKSPGPIYDDPEASKLHLNKDLRLPSEISRLLTPGHQEFVLIDRDVSCHFRVKINQLSPENNDTAPRFFAFVKDGSNTYVQRQIGVALCAVVACRNDSVASCPYRFAKNEMFTEFEELEIKMTTYPSQYNSSLSCDNTVYYPNSMRYNKFPLRSNDFIYEKSQNGRLASRGNKQDGANTKSKPREQILYKLMTPTKELISFGIWGRLYLRDIYAHKEITEEDLKNYVEIENVIYSNADLYKID